jgi:hypothetical protein
MNLRTLFLFLSFILASVSFGQVEQVTRVITPKGGKIELEPCGFIEFPKGFLKEEAEITYYCTTEASDYYPGNFSNLSWGEWMEPIALNTVIELPAKAIDPLAINDKRALRVWVPPTQLYERTTLAEIRYDLGNGEILFGIDQYDPTTSIDYPNGAASQNVHVRLSELARMVNAYDIDTISVSIVPKVMKTQ